MIYILGREQVRWFEKFLVDWTRKEQKELKRERIREKNGGQQS